MAPMMSVQRPVDGIGTGPYEARRSNRVEMDLPSDGDTWVEQLVVCEGKASKLVIRAYYKNGRTSQRVWDEPPTGASDIIYASPEMRREAEDQLRDLQGAMSNSPPEESSKAPKKGIFGGVFRKKNKDSKSKSDGSTKSQQNGRGFFGRKKKGNQQQDKAKKGKVNETVDVDLQRALALSMGQEGTQITPNDVDDIDMAKALSISVAESHGAVSSSAATEEEMLQRALAASRLEANGVASLPSNETELLLVATEDSDVSLKEKPPAVTPPEDEFLDQKMPAKPSPSKKKANEVVNQFDPYSKESSLSTAAGVAGVARALPNNAIESESTGMGGDYSEGLRKMDSDDDGHPKRGRMFAGLSKRKMEDKAGVV